MRNAYIPLRVRERTRACSPRSGPSSATCPRPGRRNGPPSRATPRWRACPRKRSSGARASTRRPRTAPGRRRSSSSFRGPCRARPPPSWPTGRLPTGPSSPSLRTGRRRGYGLTTSAGRTCFRSSSTRFPRRAGGRRSRPTSNPSWCTSGIRSTARCPSTAAATRATS
ncbi:hypothetical protein DFJ74DRAFT_673640 [Hyaloraphidium curvatum]|nr:hypothetical protein DFJ74DRAFT_673640 [Hyaloraphidium curvatum]